MYSKQLFSMRKALNKESQEDKDTIPKIVVLRTFFLPWKAPVLNLVDALSNGCFVALLSVSLAFLEVDSPEAEGILQAVALFFTISMVPLADRSFNPFWCETNCTFNSFWTAVSKGKGAYEASMCL